MSRQEVANVAARLQARGDTRVEIARTLRKRFGLGALAALRHAHGWSQADAARAWSALFPDRIKTYKEFSDWETGRYTPSLDSLDKLARLYHCDLADLLADRPGYRKRDDRDDDDGEASPVAGRRRRREGLRAARRASRHTLESLAYAVRVDRSTIIRWEAGDTEPLLRHREPLAAALRMSLDEVDALIAGAEFRAPSVQAGRREVAPGLVVEAGQPGDDRVSYFLEHPRRVDLVAVAELRDQILRLDACYETTPSVQMVGQVGQLLGHIMLLKSHAGARVYRELVTAEAEAATLTGQLVWDASQRQEQAAARLYFQQARTAAREVHNPAAEGLAFLRESFLALYGEHDPRSGLALAEQAAGVGGRASEVVGGLALLHVAEAHAMLQDRAACERALVEAEGHLERVGVGDPAAQMFSPTQPGRLAGSCYLFLGDARRAQQFLEDTAPGFSSVSKNQAIVLGNLALAHLRQAHVEEAADVLHRAIDVLEETRGGGGLNIVFDAGRELHRWQDLTVAKDVRDRLLTLMTAA